MTFAAVARVVGISQYRVLATCRRYVWLALQAADFSQVRALAIDETSRASGHYNIMLAARCERAGRAGRGQRARV